MTFFRLSVLMAYAVSVLYAVAAFAHFATFRLVTRLARESGSAGVSNTAQKTIV